MKDQRLEVKDIIRNIDDATLGKLNIPEFQRAFVWTPERATKFVDSLWRGYPVGTILLWESKYDSPRTAKGDQAQIQWIVDGQQRITTLSLLFGKKPYWWEDDADEWNRQREKYNILANISKPKESLEFGLPNPVRDKSGHWISVREVLSCQNLSGLAEEKAKQTGDDFSEVYEKLQTLKKIETYPLYEIIIDHDVEDVAKIFTRLNQAGVKVRESDVIIALVASKRQGWVRDEFNHFLSDLEGKGFEIDPGVLIRTLAAVAGVSSLKEIHSHFSGTSRDFDKSWEKTKLSIAYVVKKMGETGILTSDMLPSRNALIPLFYSHFKFGKAFNFKRALRWFLLATWDGRYSGSAMTVLGQDIKTIASSPSFSRAVKGLEDPLKVPKTFGKKHFKKDYSDDFLRLVLYLVVFKNRAKDWINQDITIGYDRADNQLNEGFRPEFHHFFPRKILKDSGVGKTESNAISNIVILNEKANRTFRSRSPNEYIHKYGVKLSRLDEQLIPKDRKFWQIDQYTKFINNRALKLAEAATAYMEELKKG